jgi:hypothetical protein
MTPNVRRATLADPIPQFANRIVSIVIAVAVGVALLVASGFTPKTATPASATTQLDRAVAAAAGRAAAAAADRAVTHAVINGEQRYREPACRAGANALKLRGLRHAVFMMECRKVL